jgi:hypothetical protein
LFSEQEAASLSAIGRHKYLARFRVPADSRGGMKVRAALGIHIIVAFFAALTLASSPQLHERLHKVDSQHECAATLIAAGNYHHAAPPPVLAAHPWAPNARAFPPQNSEVVRAVVPSSILEHAPPALI